MKRAFFDRTMAAVEEVRALYSNLFCLEGAGGFVTPGGQFGRHPLTFQGELMSPKLGGSRQTSQESITLIQSKQEAGNTWGTGCDQARTGSHAPCTSSPLLETWAATRGCWKHCGAISLMAAETFHYNLNRSWVSSEAMKRLEREKCSVLR